MKTGLLNPLNSFPATKDLTAAPQKLHFRVDPKTCVFPQIYKDFYISTQT